jgi:MoaA/NifB/PqqE/SkfB family radical SAM enzyme
MTDKHIIELIKFLGDWGVKAACFGGGGEPTLHTKLNETIKIAYEYGMDNSLVTNGTLLTDELINTIVRCCRYVGVSIDSATAETFKIGRKRDLFNKAIKNVKKLAKAAKGTRCDVAFKFLIFSYNQGEIFEACGLAKSLGVKDFHVRPADFNHQGMGELKKLNDYNIDLINDEFEQCHHIEDDDFRVFTVIHKFDDNFVPKRPFTQCYASPLVIQVCADGNIYQCPDTRFMDFFKLGSHLKLKDIKKAWNSDRHRELISQVGCKNCRSRCTYAPYNEIAERLFINQDDPMIRNLI